MYVYALFELQLNLASNRLRFASFGRRYLVFLALASPLDAAADRSLSLHMLQHMILVSPAPPLVYLGIPPAMLRAAGLVASEEN